MTTEQNSTPQPKRDSAGNIDVIRYFSSPKDTIRGWWVKGVVLSAENKEIGMPWGKWIPCKTKAEAKQLAAKLNAELAKIGRFQSVNTGSPVEAGARR